MRRTVLAFVAVAMLLVLSDPARAVEWERTSRRIAPRVTLIRLVDRAMPVRAFVLRIASPNTVAPWLAGRRFPSSASVLEVTRRMGALAGVNGDLGVGAPWHPFAIDGRLVTTGRTRGSAIALSFDGARAFIGRPRIRVVAESATMGSVRLSSWNAGVPNRGEILGYDDAGGLLEGPPTQACSARLKPMGGPELRGSWSSTNFTVDAMECDATAMELVGGVALSSRRTGAGARWVRGLEEGSAVTIRWSSGWPGVASMQGGQPMLVRDGRVVAPERCTTFMCLRQPRTGVGVGAGCRDADSVTTCTLLLAVVDGRAPTRSSGLTLVAFARLLRRLGAVDAVNMDGGGSSQLVIDGHVVNDPAVTPLREIPAVWLVRPAASLMSRGGRRT